MSKRIGLGIIGLGAMGGELLAVAADHPDFEVKLCADVSADSVAREQRNHPGIAFSTAPMDAISAAGVEAVYIATPPKFHAEYALAAMRRGQAVFCEKPLAVDLAEGEAMARLARESGVVTGINFALADRHAVLEIERALRAGEIGDVKGIEIRLAFPQWPREFQAGAAWLDGRAQGGFVREVLSHFIYLTDRLFGELTTEFAHLDFAGQGSEASAAGLLRAGSVPVRISGQAHAALPESYEWFVYGTRRSYCLRDWGELLTADGPDWRAVALDGERGSEHTRLSTLARAMRGSRREPNLPDFAAGLRVQRIIEAFHQN